MELNEKLVTDFPALPVYHMDQANALINLANLLKHRGQLLAAERAYRQALAAARKAVEKSPEGPDFRVALAIAHGNLATLLIVKGEFPEAEQALRESLDLRKKLVSDFPARPDYRFNLAHSYTSLGVLLWQAGRSGEADGPYGEAVKIGEKLAADFPRADRYQSKLGAVLNNWALLLRDRGQLEPARQKLEQAIHHQKAAHEANPKHPQYGDFLSGHYSNLANILEDLKAPPAQADDAAQQAITVMKKLSADFPDVPEYQSGAGGSLHNLALLHQRRGQLEQARPLLEEAIPYQQVALKANPRSPKYREFLGNHYHELAEVLRQLEGPLAETENAYRQAIVLRKELAADFPDVAAYQSDAGAALHNYGIVLNKRGQLEQRRALLEEAIRYQQVALKVKPRSPRYRQFLGNHYHTLADVLRQLKGPLAETENAYRQALVVRTELAAEFPKNAGYQKDVEVIRKRLDTLSREKGQPPEAWPR